MKRFTMLCLAALASASAAAQTAGFLCCNMRTDGAWISDINYLGQGKTMIPAGTPLTMNGYGKNRVHVVINGRKQDIGNDYSRSISLETFARRYVVAQDPLERLNTYPRNIQEAIGTARLTKGMTREQVIMAVGYPVSDENPDLESKTWRFWLSSRGEFKAIFDDAGRLTRIDANAEIRPLVVAE
ncbi:MAG: hypothetical protein WA049_02875 [Ferribacterium limneticum]